MRHTTLERNEDPILDIRLAISRTLEECGVSCDHEVIVDRSIDKLPDFFRGTLYKRKLLSGQPAQEENDE